MTKPRPHFWEFLSNKYRLLSTKRIWICVQCKILCGIVTTCTVVNFEIKFLPKPHYVLNKSRVLLWKMIPATWNVSHTCAIKLNMLVPWCSGAMADTDMMLLIPHRMCELASVYGLWTAVLDTSRITCHTCITEHWEQKWFTLIDPLQLLDIQ